MENYKKKILRFLRNFSWYLDYTFFNFLPRKEASQTFRRILIIELDKIGDILMITPTLRSLSLFYHTKVDVMVQPSMRDVLLHNPYVDKILPYGRQEIQNNYSEIVQRLQGKYDLAVLLHPGSRVVSKLLKDIKTEYRVGVTRPGFFDGKGHFLHKKNKPNFSVQHKIRDNLDVITTTLGIVPANDFYELFTSSDAEKSVEAILLSEKIKQPFILIHAAPEYLSHQWNSEKFAKLADYLTVGGYFVVFSGSQKDIPINDEIISFMKNNVCNLAGTTTIQQFFALIKKSCLVVSVDTSAMHIAAALHVPVVALFGEGDPKIWGPYSENSKVIFKEKEMCKSCSKWFGADRVKHGCMDIIRVEEVLEAVHSLLK